MSAQEVELEFDSMSGPKAFFEVEVELIDSFVLVSGAQQNDSVIYIVFSRFFSIRSCYKIVNTVPCTI